MQSGRSRGTSLSGLGVQAAIDAVPNDQNSALPGVAPTISSENSSVRPSSLMPSAYLR
jgi:hypothetical protein